MPAEKGFKELLLEKLPDLLGVLAFVVGAIFFVLAAIQNISYGKLKASIDDPQWRVWTAVAGIALIVIGIFIQIWSLKKSSVSLSRSQADDFRIKIVFPTPYTPVNSVTVQGTIKKSLPEGYELWIFRLYHDGRYYPLHQCIVNDDNNWTAPNCDAGGVQGDYRAFAATLVGPDGKALIGFVREANQRFAPIRKELIALSKKDVQYLPTVGQFTRDTVVCDRVSINPI